MDIVLVPVHLGMHWCVAVRKLFVVKRFTLALVTNVASFSQFKSATQIK